MKYFLLFLGVLFVLFAVVQFNDPDPALWVLIYLTVSAFCFLAFSNRFYPWATLLIAVACVVWAIFLFPPSFHDWWQLEEEAQSLKMKMPGIEEARESMGLLISAAALFFLFFKGRKRVNP